MDTGSDRQFQSTLITAISAEIGARGWSRNELARRAGINAQQIQRIMSLKRDMTVAQLGRIIEALGVTPTYLLSEAERRRDMANTLTPLGRKEIAQFLAAPNTDETLNARLSEAEAISGTKGSELTQLLDRVAQLRREELLRLQAELDRADRPYNHHRGVQ